MNRERSYTESKALNEAASIQGKIKAGEAGSYDEAEQFLEPDAAEEESKKSKWLAWFSKEDIKNSDNNDNNIVDSKEKLRDQLGVLAEILDKNDFEYANRWLFNLLESPGVLKDDLREETINGVRLMIKNKASQLVKVRDYEQFVRVFNYLSDYGSLSRTDFLELTDNLPKDLKLNIGFQLGWALMIDPEVYIRKRQDWSEAGFINADEFDRGFKHVIYGRLRDALILGNQDMAVFKNIHENYARHGLITPDVKQALVEVKEWSNSRKPRYGSI